MGSFVCLIPDPYIARKCGGQFRISLHIARLCSRYTCFWKCARQTRIMQAWISDRNIQLKVWQFEHGKTLLIVSFHLLFPTETGFCCCWGLENWHQTITNNNIFLSTVEDPCFHKLFCLAKARIFSRFLLEFDKFSLVGCICNASIQNIIINNFSYSFNLQ